MEIPTVWQLHPHIGEEKYQMLELNKRLESYLGRVKLLEEENQLLRGEIQALQRNRDTKGQIQVHEEALNLARREVQAAWMKKDRAELEVSNLVEEMEALNAQRQKERVAQAEAKRKLAEYKKMLEDEWRMQIWLREQAAHLEKEVSLQVQVHQEEMASLKSTSAVSKPILLPPQHGQNISLQGLGEEYSQRAAQAWQEAAGVYQRQVEQLEDSLNRARAQMAQINQEKKENQLYVQDLAKELESTKVKRELLEKNIAQQRERQNQELQQLQVQVEALESEKVDLGEQIGDLLVDTRDLLQTKMSLGLEVATYRALLDTESLRVNSQSTRKTSVRTESLLGVLSKPHGIHPDTQTISASSLLSSLLTTSRSITHSKANLMTPTRSWSLTQSTQDTPKTGQNGEKEEGIKDLQEILTENQSKARQDTSSPEEAALISLPAGHLSSIPQTPEGEVPSNLHTEDTKGSEDGEEEETEVSTEMAQISHAPMFSWEENDTAIPEEKDVVSELELESENTSENYMQECRTDNRFKLTDLKQLGEDSENPALPLYEQTSLHSVDAFSHDGKKREIITWEDNAKESVSNIPGMESLKSAPEVEKQSIERWEEVDTIEEIEDEAEVEHCGTDEQDCHHSDVELQEKETKNDSETEESKVEVKKEQKVSDGEEDKVEEEQKMDEHIAVIDEISANTGKEPIIQGSSALELKVDLHRNSEHTEETTDLVVDTYQDDHLLVEDHAEEQIQSDEDESLNISASWRTDLGEADSYAQENTLADTRPLIHYKSDEEADANTQASHMGVSDSEEEREKYEEVLMWSQNIAKRFDTMEDLSEQPENAYPDDVVLEESAQTVVEENIDEITKEDPVEPVSEDILQGKITDVDINVDLLKDDTLVDLVENDFMDREESIQGVEETEKKNQVLLVQEQEESSGLQNWSQRFVSETEQHALPFEQPATGEDDIVITNDNTESCNMESFVQIKSEGEGESGMKTHSDYFPLVTDKPQLEPSQEQALEEESHEMSSTEITYSDVFPTESNLTEEQVFTKEEEDKQSNMSMFSHADFTDNLSQHSGLNSRPESQSNIANSDLEESNSSEDESPNASQCSQLLSHTAMSTKLLDFSNTATSGDVSKHDSVSFTGLMEEVMKGRFEKDSVENYSTSQEAEWESVSQNKEEEQLSVDNSSSRMHGNNSSLPQMQEWKDIDYPDITGASNNILSGITIEDNKASEKEDIFQGRVLNEEPQTKEKENDLHSFFTSSIKEDIWSATKFEMAATFDSNEPIDTTHTIHPNQSMTFEEDWGDLGSLKAANGKEMSMSTAQSEEEEKREEQEMSQAKQLQCQDVKGGQVETVQSDDSVDDGDSWSSGEE
ncbi:hypothetical protein AOLI_G00051860 [Acnodon oligacanthus]